MGCPGPPAHCGRRDRSDMVPLHVGRLLRAVFPPLPLALAKDPGQADIWLVRRQHRRLSLRPGDLVRSGVLSRWLPGHVGCSLGARAALLRRRGFLERTWRLNLPVCRAPRRRRRCCHPLLHAVHQARSSRPRGRHSGCQRHSRATCACCALSAARSPSIDGCDHRGSTVIACRCALFELAHLPGHTDRAGGRTCGRACSL